MSGPQRLLLALALLAYPADFRKSFRDEIVADIEEMRANPFTAAFDIVGNGLRMRAGLLANDVGYARQPQRRGRHDHRGHARSPLRASRRPHDRIARRPAQADSPCRRIEQRPQASEAEQAQPFLLLLGVRVCIGDGSVRHSSPSSSAIFRVVDKLRPPKDRFRHLHFFRTHPGCWHTPWHRRSSLYRGNAHTADGYSRCSGRSRRLCERSNRQRQNRGFRHSATS